MPHADQGWLATRVVAALAAIGLAALLPEYWLFLATSALVSGIALLGLGVLGRAGMYSLCQLSFAAVGAWVVTALNTAAAPGGLFVWILAGGVAALPLGALIGLPALRLRGVHLALVTLGFAAAADVVIAAVRFPGMTTFQQVPRPDVIATDRAYFVFAALTFVATAASLGLLARTRFGAAWHAVRFSERAAAAAGTSVPVAKLSAFALSAFTAGLAGGVLAGQIGMITAENFRTMGSLALFVVAVMVGAQYAAGALFGGLLMTFVPELFQRLAIPQDWGLLLFAFGAVQAMSQGTSLSEDMARRLRARSPRARSPRAGRRQAPPLTAPEAAGGRAGMVTSDGRWQPPDRTATLLEVHGITVTYGEITVLRDVDLLVPRGTVMGLIGPNGAGKSTLTDALTGFVGPAAGSVALAGKSLDGLAAHRRSAAGLRRTFQQDRVPSGLTVDAYLRFAAHRRVERAELEEVCDFLGCPAPARHISELPVGGRRLLEVAGALLSRPKLVVLDEPAAGLAYAESLALADRLIEVPERYGASVLLIEHNLDVVRKACTSLVVLTFGEVIAEGPPRQALALPEVARAYMGDEVALA